MRKRNWILSAALLAAVVGSWILSFDNSSSVGEAVLGGYRQRWFLLNVALSFVAFWVTVAVVLRPKRRAWLRIIVVHLGIFMALFAVETTAYCGLIDFADILDSGRRGMRPRAETHEALRRMGRPDLEYQGKAPPNLVRILGADAAPLPIDYRTDAYGLRNIGEKKDPRVVCLGDSMLVAGFVKAEHILTERLQELLGVQVLNVAEPSYSPQEELLRFESTGLSTEGRMVIQFLFEGNDLVDSRRWRDWRKGSDSRSWQSRSLCAQMLSRLQGPRAAAGRRRHGEFQLASGETAEIYFLYDALQLAEAMPEFAELTATLSAAKRDIESNGGSYRVVLLPAKLRVLHDFVSFPNDSDLRDPKVAANSFAEKLRAFTSDAKIPFLDMTEDLKAVAAKGELPFIPADTHLNATGHEAIAKRVAVWVGDLR